MAVFPRKIVLKSTNNVQGRVEQLLTSNPISQGELVYQTQGNDSSLFVRAQSGLLRKFGSETLGTYQTAGYTYSPEIPADPFGVVSVTTPAETLIDDLLVVMLCFKGLNSTMSMPDVVAPGWNIHTTPFVPAPDLAITWSGDSSQYMLATCISKLATQNGSENIDITIKWDDVTFGHLGAGFTCVAVRDTIARLGVAGITGHKSQKGDTPFVGCSALAGGLTYGFAYSDIITDPNIQSDLNQMQLPFNPVDAWSYVAGDHATNITTTSANQSGYCALGSTSSATGFSASRTNPANIPSADKGATHGLMTVFIKPSGPARATLLSIDEIHDVDTTSVPPSIGDVLYWNGLAWVNSAQPPLAGSPAGTIVRVNSTKNTVAGQVTINDMGSSGSLVAVTTDQPAWVIGYSTAESRAADGGRTIGTDPAAGAGVLFEVLTDGVTTYQASPGTGYFNGDPTGAPNIYIATKNPDGTALDCLLSLTGYMHQGFNGFGTSRVIASTTPDGNGEGVLTTIGQTGQFVSVSTDVGCWLTFYTTAAARAADTRTYGQVITPGAGICAEFFLSDTETQVATPGQFYLNNDITATSALYYSCRDSSKVPVAANLEIVVYAEAEVNTIDGGTYGSG